VTNEEGVMPQRKKKKTRPAAQSATVLNAGPAAKLVSRKSDYEAEYRLLIAALLTATFIWSCSPMMGFDIWWHLKTGQMILEEHTIPFVDWFTYSDSEAAWVDLHWGFQLLAASTYAAGGVALLVLAKAAMITATVAIGAFATSAKLDCCVRVGVWSLVAIVLTGRGIVRPEILSLLFLATWLAILLRAHTRPKLLWCLPALLVVWVNCHALFVFGLVVFACWVFDGALRHFADGRWGLARLEEETAGVQQIIVVGALLAVACLINPYFEEGALFPLVLFRKLSVDEAFYSVRVDEFTSPAAFFGQIGLRSLHLDAAAVLWLLAAASFVWLATFRRVSIFRSLLFVAFSYLGFKMIRNLSPAAVVSGMVLCENLSESFGLRNRLRNANAASASVEPANDQTLAKEASNRRRRSIALSVVLFGLAASHFSGHWGRLTGLGDRFGLREATAWHSHDAAKFAGQPGFPDRAIVASFGQAAVYEFHNGPARRVLMDGRLEVCTRETFELYESILRAMAQGDPAWQQLPGVADAQGRLPAIILDSRSARDEINGIFQLPEWRLVFADSAAAVFVSSELANELGLAPADPTPLMHPPS
jgi:hypothetical protein